MTQEKIDRINALARKKKEEGLSPAEQAEQAQLRQEYVAAVRQSLEGQLSSITILEPDGRKRKLKKKG